MAKERENTQDLTCLLTWLPRRWKDLATRRQDYELAAMRLSPELCVWVEESKPISMNNDTKDVHPNERTMILAHLHEDVAFKVRSIAASGELHTGNRRLRRNWSRLHTSDKSHSGLLMQKPSAT